MTYAGIGSRQTPTRALAMMRLLGGVFAMAGYHLRSGGAEGADTAFAEGCMRWHGSKTIYRPKDAEGDARALLLAKEHHPNWNALSPCAQLLMARNGYQILGRDLKRPSDFVVCWTPNGKMIGGTSQALRIAAQYRVPIYNLAIPEDWNVLYDLIEPLLKHI